MATGTVRKRNNKWQIDISLGYIDGKQKRKRWTSKATTKAEAVNEMNDELYKLNRQTRSGEAYDNEYPLKDLFEEWSQYTITNNTNPKTAHDYILTARRLVEFYPENANVSDVTPRSIDERLSQLTETLSNNSINKSLARFKAMLRYGVSRKVIHDNPINDVKPLPCKRVKLRRALTNEEAKSLINNAPGEWPKLWRFILSTGLRKQEVIELRWKNVDLEKGIIRVLPTDKWKPKSETGIRTIPLSDDVRNDLASIKKNSNTERVFTTSGGEKLNTYFLKALRAHMHNAFCEIYGLPYGKRLNKTEQIKYNEHKEKIEKELKLIDLHGLRYTFCTHLIGSGVDIKTVQKLMGHSSPDVTLKIYAQYCHGNAENAVKNFPW